MVFGCEVIIQVSSGDGVVPFLAAGSGSICSLLFDLPFGHECGEKGNKAEMSIASM